jgi:uncharacterized protein YndB with AHSA1/START domain
MPATPDGTETVEHEVSVAARPEVVFEFFTDPRASGPSSSA